MQRCYIPTCRLARVVAIAVVDTVVAPYLAHEEGQGLRVLGDVGDDAALADAVVCELLRIARVLVGSHGGDAGLLEADEGALGLVLLAPEVWSMLETRRLEGQDCGRTSGRRRNGVWVDAVGVVEAGLGSDDAGRGSNAEGEDGTHGGGVGGVWVKWERAGGEVGGRSSRGKEAGDKGIAVSDRQECGRRWQISTTNVRMGRGSKREQQHE